MARVARRDGLPQDALAAAHLRQGHGTGARLGVGCQDVDSSWFCSPCTGLFQTAEQIDGRKERQDRALGSGLWARLGIHSAQHLL